MAHVFRNKVVDYVVAKDLDDARAIITDYYEDTLDSDFADEAADLQQMPDDAKLSMRMEDAEPGEEESLTQTAGEWAANWMDVHEGVGGFLGSTEW